MNWSSTDPREAINKAKGLEIVVWSQRFGAKQAWVYNYHTWHIEWEGEDHEWDEPGLFWCYTPIPGRKF